MLVEAMKILLYTDNLMTKAQLEGSWRNTGAVLATSDTGAEPDLIVFDLTAKNNLTLIKRLRTEYPDTEILVFAPHVDGDAFRLARQAGATSQVARGKVVERVLKRLQG